VHVNEKPLLTIRSAVQPPKGVYKRKKKKKKKHPIDSVSKKFLQLNHPPQEGNFIPT